MSGPWETRLRLLAEGGLPWDLPISRDLVARLNVLKTVLDRVASDPGLAGASGDAAKESVSTTSAAVSAQVDYVEGALQSGIDAANRQRERAGEALAKLPTGALSADQESMVRTAAVGSMVVFGPLAVVAGEGALALMNNGLAAHREEAAQRAVEAISDDLDAVPVTPPPSTRVGSTFQQDATPPTDGGGHHTGESMSTSIGRGRSYEAFADHHISPVSALPAGVAYADPNAGSGSWDGGSGSHGSGGGGVIDLGNPGGRAPTADGSIGGIGTMPGTGQVPGAGWGGAGSAGGLGSGLAAGLVAGAGGAAAVNRLSRGVGVGESGAGGRGVSASGGLLGKTGAAGAGGAGSGLGVRGGAGTVGGGGTGGPGSGRGAGMRAGATGGAGVGTGAGGSGAPGGGAAGGRGATAGAGGAGSHSDRKGQGRGLGGPIAPRMDDDEEIRPRSHNAAAGSRDDT